jgi:Tfp pilus assembly major pilin PilA
MYKNNMAQNIDEELKSKVIKYFECDDNIKELQKKIKEIKTKKDQCEEYILQNLDKYDTSTIEFKGYKLTKNVVETKTACKLDIVKETLQEELNDVHKVTQLMDKMDGKREVKEKTVLKRSKK